jgi:predicted ATPase/DNA-binding SARP family transcriptional activator
VDIRLLGPVELCLTASGEPVALPGTKTRGLLAMLAIEHGRTVSPQRLVDALWGEQEVHGLNVVQGAVSKLRRAVSTAGGPNIVITGQAGYALDVDRAQIDLHRFETLTERAGRADPALAADLLSSALALWRGPALGGAPTTGSLDAVRVRLDELRESALDDLADARLALGHHHQLVGDIEALVAADPLRERRWGQLMRALYGAGRQADAMRAFQRARTVLIEQVGAEPGPDLRRLEAAVLVHDDEVLMPASPSSGHRPVGEGFRRVGNARHATGPLIGRRADLRLVTDLLDGHRFVTLTGPGGVGKTRLALEVCAKVPDQMTDGVWWVDLRPISTAGEALAAILRCLRVEMPSSADTEALVDTVIELLSGRQALIVLDNCEQVIADLASVVQHLVTSCDRLRLLATSRESFGVMSERVVALDPLSADAARELFEIRLEGLGLAEEESASTIDRLCARLDRLPLALELAAARARYLRLDEILERLSDRLDLGGDVAGVGSQRQSLDAVASWSYGLLDERERRVFERLSVFGDGATSSAAAAVCAAGDIRPDDVEGLLYRLVDKSMVVADRSGAQTRFGMLQTLTDYAAGRLLERDDESDARLAHAQWVAHLAGTVGFGTKTSGSVVAAVEDERVAIRDAVSWSLSHEPALALSICEALCPFWFGAMRVSEGWQLLSSALAAAAAGDDASGRTLALAWAAVFATMLQDDDRARQYETEAVRLDESFGGPMAGPLSTILALAAGYTADVRWSRWIDEAVSRTDVEHDPGWTGYTYFADGAFALVVGDLERADTALRAALRSFERHGDHLGLVLAVSRLGELALRVSDLELYRTMHAQLLELGQAGRSIGVIAGASARLGHAYLLGGELEEAERLARSGLASSGAGFMPVIDGYVLRTAGLVNLALGHAGVGEDQLRQAIQAFEDGAGGVGVGQAAMVWLDVGASLMDRRDLEGARAAADSAAGLAQRSGDPWIQQHVDEHRSRMTAMLHAGL